MSSLLASLGTPPLGGTASTRVSPLLRGGWACPPLGGFTYMRGTPLLGVGWGRILRAAALAEETTPLSVLFQTGGRGLRWEDRPLSGFAQVRGDRLRRCSGRERRVGWLRLSGRWRRESVDIMCGGGDASAGCAASVPFMCASHSSFLHGWL